MNLRNQKGIALILVLGAVLVLSTILVDFAYNAHVTYELASSERDRLKAYYLARSGLQLVQLELKTEKNLRTNYASLLQQIGGTGISSDPLCKQLPLSTGLLRGITVDFAPEDQQFLSFDGDFDVSCDSEERKINLNVFRAANTASSTTSSSSTSTIYDSQKSLLTSLLSQPEYEELFKDKREEITKVVNAIADWVDADDRINEAPGITGSDEDTEYQGSEFHYKVKNGKYETTDELLLVAGMGDDLFKKIKDQVTVFGNNKINLCQADEAMVRAFVQSFTQNTPGAIPISPTDELKWTEILSGIQLACQQTSPTSAGIAAAITQATGAAVNSTLASQISTSTTSQFYRFESVGEVQESRVRITSVVYLPSRSSNPAKTLYFRVDSR